MKKYPIITITESLHNTIVDAMQEDSCLAKAIDIVCNELYHCDIRELTHGYCSNEYKTIRYIVESVYNKRDERLHIVKGG
jgi:hypothetical protein